MLSKHQKDILNVVIGIVKQGNYAPTAGNINDALKEAGVSSIGRRFLDIYKSGEGLVYNMNWMLELSNDEIFATVEREVAEQEKKPRKPRTTKTGVVPVVPTEETEVDVPAVIASVAASAPAVPEQAIGYYVPMKDKNFVSFGPMQYLEKIIANNVFLPTYIYGDTGIAKSMSVVQACARTGRELFRVNVNINTDEEDFIGGFRLESGRTVWQDGPLVAAMKRGAILLIDEISALNPANAFALFSVLEGNELYIKKTNERVVPANGFNVIVTDNTRGKGSMTGRFVGTNVQNDALLDRFVVSLEYTYPTPAQELKILNGVDNSNKELNRNLIKWASIVRTSFADGIVDETISVRKLVSILEINKVFQDIVVSINLALNRYEEETRKSIIDLFNKVVADPLFASLKFDELQDEVQGEVKEGVDEVLDAAKDEMTAEEVEEDKDELEM